jgi:predicted dehydrogenase
MPHQFGWCFIGAGNIARKVADDSSGIHIVSVCARHIENARRFAEEYGAKAYDTTAAAVQADGVDAVYVAVQHPEHHPVVLETLRLGKPVLCEKPLAVNRRQVEEMIAAAKQSGLFLMEAMWPRFNPVLKTVRHWIESGEIGDVHYMTADFSGAVDNDGKMYHFQKSRAGGALLDMGVYPVALAQMVFGEAPRHVRVHAKLWEGIDMRLAAQFEYSDGRTAGIFTAFDTHSEWTATIHGSRGLIVIPQYWKARSAELIRKNGEKLRAERDGCIGWGYQMRGVEALVLSGAKESPDMPLSDSLAIISTMDEMRKAAGLVYEWD